MQPLLYLAEIIFVVLFVATLVEFVRHRDPVSRDVALSFSALGILFVVQIWRDLGGAAPEVASAVGGGLFILQPVFTLHLVSLIRPVSPRLLWGGAAILVGGALPVVVFRIQEPVLTVVVASVFIGLQAAAAGYLLVEARRRHGPGAVRMALAAASTGTFAAALVVSVLGSGPGETGTATAIATLMAVVAGLGYLVAFVPPALVREIWQARTTVEYTRDLIGRSREPVPAIWAAFVEMAVRMQGGAAVMIAGARLGSRPSSACPGSTTRPGRSRSTGRSSRPSSPTVTPARTCRSTRSDRSGIGSPRSPRPASCRSYRSPCRIARNRPRSSCWRTTGRCSMLRTSNCSVRSVPRPRSSSSAGP